jgi:hypothetical protein
MHFIAIHFSRPGCFTEKLALIKKGVNKNGILIRNNGICRGWSNGSSSQRGLNRKMEGVN